jgi:hypothetical protein
MEVDADYLAYLDLLQRGVISRRQALSAGVTPRGLQHRTGPGGPWQRLLPGVYLMTTGEPSRDQLVSGAQLYAGDGSLITGPAALRFYGIRCHDTDLVDVLVRARSRPASRGYVTILRTRRMPLRRVSSGATRYAPAARCVADALCGMDHLARARTIVASAVQQRKCTLDQLTAEAAARHNKGDAILRRVLAEVLDGIRSSPEGDLRDLIRGSGLPAPMFNPDLYLNDVFLARPDAWWEHAAVAVEVDSRQFHLLPQDWEQTMTRHSRMTAAGILVLHFSPRQLLDEPGRVLQEIAAALAAGRPAPAVTTRAAA